MPSIPKTSFNFSKGYIPDAGPLFAEQGYLKDGLNTLANIQGDVGNRQGIEILDETKVYTIEDKSDITNNFLPSIFYGEVTKIDGSVLELIFLTWGKTVFVYANDGDTYTNSIVNLGANTFTPDFTFFMSGFSDQAWYYKSRIMQTGNTFILSNPYGPLHKFVWGDIATGSDTLSMFRVELSEYDENIYKVPRAATQGRAIPGFYCVDIPCKTGVTDYSVLEFAATAAPGYTTTLYLIDSNKHHTIQDSSLYTYTETFNSDIFMVTGSVSLTGITVATGDVIRVYFGNSELQDFTPSTAREEVVLSNINKDYATDGSHSFEKVVTFGGRHWFTSINGPIDVTDDATYPTLGHKPNKLWVSEIFSPDISKEANTHLLCRPIKSPLDKDDNLALPNEGGVVLLDDAARILDAVPYGNSLFVIATNGVWLITGPDEFFSLGQAVVKKVIDHTFITKECAVATDKGVIIFGESEVFFAVPPSQRAGVEITNLVEGRISSFYNNIDIDVKRNAIVRYDKDNKRAYFICPDVVSDAASKYNSSSMGNKGVVFDFITNAWHTPVDYSSGDWMISDMITVPAKTYFSSSDSRRSEHRRVNLVLLAKKNSSFTDVVFGILEGEPYCADYYGSEFKAAFSSFAETTNILSPELGLGNSIQVAKLYLQLKRQEQNDADAAGFYQYPGSCYLQRRWKFADNVNAGPLYDYSLDETGDNWVEQRQQVYFPYRLGALVIGGKKPGYEVIPFTTKIRGRGEVIRFRFGNHFGNETLTGTIQEQEKGWGLYGYEILLTSYR